MDALIVVDMQKGIFNKSIRVYDSDVLINQINMMIDFCHYNMIPIIFLRYTGEIVLKENTENWELITELHIDQNDIIIDKFGSDAFQTRKFLDVLEQYKIDHVFVSGVFSHGCVQSTVLGALHHNMSVSLIGDAHSNLAQNALGIIQSVNERMEKIGVRLLSTENFINLTER